MLAAHREHTLDCVGFCRASHPETGTSSCLQGLVVLTGWIAPAGRLARRKHTGRISALAGSGKARIDRWDGSGCTFGKDRDALEANIIISGDHRDRILRTRSTSVRRSDFLPQL